MDLNQDAEGILLVENDKKDDEEEHEEVARSNPSFGASLFAHFGGLGELPGVCGFSRVASFLLMISKFSWFPVHEVFVVGGFEGFDGCFDFSGSTFRVPELLESRQWLSSGVCTFAWGSGVVG